jgi:hypothetical protein
MPLMMGWYYDVHDMPLMMGWYYDVYDGMVLMYMMGWYLMYMMGYGYHCFIAWLTKPESGARGDLVNCASFFSICYKYVSKLYMIRVIY